MRLARSSSVVCLVVILLASPFFPLTWSTCSTAFDQCR
jgi:hypothetical protein